MPCNTVRTMSVDLGKVSPDYMLAALTELKLAPVQNGDVIRFGNNEWINAKTGKSQLSTMRNVSEIKQAYSTQVVTRTAQRFGWQLRKVGPNRMQVIKR